VTPNFFDVVGVRPVRGRAFLRDAPETLDSDVIISTRVWRDHFASRPDVVGRAMRVNGVPRTIVGVLSPDFVFRTSTFSQPDGPDVWIPLRLDPNRHGSWFLRLLGRMRPGVTAAQAHLDLLAVTKAVIWAYPHGRGIDPVVTPLADDVATDVRRVLAVLAAAVALLLVVACTNAAALFLVRAVGRDRELAVRLAIGASRGRIVRQLVTESVVLASLAGVAGVASAIWLTRLLVAFAPATRIPRLERVVVDTPVVIFAVLLTLAVGVLFGLVPAWQSARAGRPGQLVSGAPGRVTSSRATERWRGVLVALQVTSTSVLLVGAVLLGRSLVRLTSNDDGFSSRAVVSATIQLPDTTERPAALALWRGLLDDLRRRPGFEGASAINQMPLNDFFFIRGDFTLEGQRLESAWTAKPKVAPGYFRALGIPLVRGRDFAATDDAGAPPVAIVSELFVRLYMAGRDPIGARVSLSDGKAPWFTIVGVVGDIRQSGPADTPIQAVYVPYAQSEGTFFVHTLSLVVPTMLDTDAVAQGVREALRRIDPTLPVLDVSRLDDLRVRTMAEPRFRTFLIAVFALVAWTLAAAGLFALVSQSVAQRWRELGVRLALGARPEHIARLVIARAMWPVAIGLAAGLGLALWLAAALAPFLFEIAPRDLASIVLATALLLASALAASAWPAWRATRIDPTTALRLE
jgi:putative ABC transport system permease protein